MLCQRYHQRPATYLGITDLLAAYQIDEAVAMAGILASTQAPISRARAPGPARPGANATLDSLSTATIAPNDAPPGLDAYLDQLIADEGGVLVDLDATPPGAS